MQGQPDGTLRLEYVTTDADVQEGDIIVTSGIGGVYPKGLPLGTVSTVVREENATYYTITVTPASSDTENNEEVLVITSLNSGQQASDEEVAQANDAPQGTSRTPGSGSSGSSGTTGNSGSSSGGDGDGSGSSSDGE